MARTTATTRTVASARSSASARTAISAYRVPIDLLNIGVTHLWDWRTGFLGSNNVSVASMIGNIGVSYKGGTAIASVYTSGMYQIDLERSNSDAFVSNAVKFINGATAFTCFAWIKQESVSSARAIITHWETTGGQRRFMMRHIAANQYSLSLSENGSTQAVYDSDSSFSDTGSWHFIVMTYNTTNRCVMYRDNVVMPNSLTSGSHPASIFSGTEPLLIGAQLPSAPTNFWDGNIGICGICDNYSVTSDQATKLYEITNIIGRYI